MNSTNGADLIQSPKAAIVTASVAGTAGMGTLLEYIPSVLGIGVSALSVLMLIVLIRYHWLNSRKIKMEINQLEDEAKCRQEAGLPCRRHTDKDYAKN